MFDTVPIDSLTPHPQNPRQGDIDKIAESIKANGFYGVVQVQRSTAYIVAGNHRWKAAKQVGMTEVPVEWLDVDDEEALRILLADNRTSDLATYDEAALVGILDDIPDFTGTGYTNEDYDALVASSAALIEDDDLNSGAETAVANEDSARIMGGVKEVRLIFQGDESKQFERLLEAVRVTGETTSVTVLRAMAAV